MVVVGMNQKREKVVIARLLYFKSNKPITAYRDK